MSNSIECPSCHNKNHLEDAIYCQACGIELNNYCKDDNCYANKENEHYLNALPKDALFCPYCGGKTTYHDYLVR